MKKLKTDNLIKEATKLLKKGGWNVLVIGDVRVEQRSLRRKYNYELVIGFTGRKQK